MTVTEIVDYLANDEENKYPTANDKLEVLYNTLPPRLREDGRKIEKYSLFDWGQPSAKDVSRALNSLAQWVKGETKAVTTGPASPDSRAKLIRDIRDYMATTRHPAFHDIDPGVYAIQLALRVRRPRSIDQGATGLCGAVSAAYTFAKTRPAEYMKFGLDLFFDGRAKFGQLQVAPSQKIKSNYSLRKDKIPWAVDYVVLVSLRECTFTSDAIGIDLIRGADETVLPGRLAQWLRDAGYKNVEDHTFFGKNQQAVVSAFAAQIGQPVHFGNATGDALAKQNRLKNAKTNLASASQAFAMGKMVFLFSDGEIGHKLAAGISGAMTEQRGPTGLGDHHWMAVKKLTIPASNVVTLKAVTWGKSLEGSYDLDAFVSRYNGYLVADA